MLPPFLNAAATQMLDDGSLRSFFENFKLPPKEEPREEVEAPKRPIATPSRSLKAEPPAKRPRILTRKVLRLEACVAD